MRISLNPQLVPELGVTLISNEAKTSSNAHQNHFKLTQVDTY